MRTKIAYFAFFLSIIPIFVFSITNTPAAVSFKGVVLDAQLNEPIPTASISLMDNLHGTTTDNQGKFSLLINGFESKVTKISVSCMGYVNDTITLIGNQKDLRIKLNPKLLELEEVVVKTNRYHNKDNPAVELIEKVISNKSKNVKEALNYYETEKYEKIQFALDDITPKFKQKRIFKHFQFIFKDLDTIPGTEKELLPIYLKESMSDIYYNKDPKKKKEIIKSDKKVRFGYVDNNGVEDYIKYMYQDVNIYDDNVVFLTNQFLSPIASVAPKFYRYYIADTIQSGADKYVQLYFGARNKQDMLFQGYLYVALDGSYAIKGVELTVNKNINLNWVKSVKINQQFEKMGEQGWMLASDETTIGFGLTNKSHGIIGSRSVFYDNYQFEPTKNDSIFSGKNVELQDGAEMRDDAYWAVHRPLELTKSEASTYSLVDSIQNVPVFKRTMDFATIILFGYKDMDWYEIGPINTFYSYNPVEGVRVRLGGRTTPKFSKKVNFETYLGYGFKDENMKYFLSNTWSLSPGSIYEFPVKSIKFSYQKDTKLPGQDLQFVQEDNVLLSIKRGVNDKLFYTKTFKVEHLNEFENHFSYTLGYQYNNMTPGGSLYFNYTDYMSHTNDVSSINLSEVSLKLRYAPNEKYYQGKSFRVPILTKYPVIELQVNAGSEFLKSDYNYQNIRLSVSKRFFYSMFGYSDVVWESGKIFGKVPYPLLNVPRANQTYSYQILSYNLMNFLEFVSDEYTSLIVDHCFNGFFVNKIPLIKNLNLREYATCKILYGKVSDTNDPDNNSDLFKFPVQKDGTPLTYSMGNKPYIEGSIGIGNIFKIFRIDLVKRFTYLDNPNVSELGLRMRFRFDF